MFFNFETGFMCHFYFIILRVVLVVRNQTQGAYTFCRQTASCVRRIYLCVVLTLTAYCRTNVVVRHLVHCEVPKHRDSLVSHPSAVELAS